MRIAQIIYLALLLVSMLFVEAYGAEDNGNDLKGYLDEEYIQETLARIRAISKSDKENVKNEELDDALALIDDSFIDELALLVERTTNITAAKIKYDNAYKTQEACNYFLISVSLRGIKKTLEDLQGCKHNQCSIKVIGRHLDIMYLDYRKLSNLMSTCPE